MLVRHTPSHRPPLDLSAIDAQLWSGATLHGRLTGQAMEAVILDAAKHFDAALDQVIAEARRQHREALMQIMSSLTDELCARFPMPKGIQT